MTNDKTRPIAAVVNDDLTQLNMLCALMRKAGIEPLPFDGAEAALAAMNPEDPPGLIVTDLYMPGIDGWRFCRLLRSPEYAAFNELPILVVSATFAGGHPERIAADVGADAFLPSPVDGKEFVAQARALLAGKKARRLPRVLIVEDSKTLAGLLKKTFTAHGYQVDVALTATEAQLTFAKTPYDAVALDHHLPDGTGDALLDAFSAQRPDCVFLMMTTDPTPELALDWMKRGAAAYVRKPFEAEFLIELCAKARRERALLRVQDLLEVRTRELCNNETQYRALFNQSMEGIYLHDLEGRILDVNEMACAQSGYSREEWLGLTVFDGHPGTSITNIPKSEMIQAWKHWTPGQRFIVEAEHQRKDGVIYPVEISTGLVCYEGSNYILAVVKDITERKRLERLLRIERDLAQALMSANTLDETLGLCLDAAIAASEFDAGGVYLVDPKTGQIVLRHHRGLSDAFIEAARHFDSDSPQAQLLQAGKPIYTRYRETGMPINGARSAEALSAIAIVPINHHDQLIGCLNIASHTQGEIPEHVRAALEKLAGMMGHSIAAEQAREALRESEEKHRRLFETIAQGIIYQDANGEIISANPAAERILNLSFDAMKGKTSMDPHWQMILEDGTPVPGTEHPAMVALRTGQTVGPVTRGIFSQAPNSLRWLSITAIPIFAPGADRPHQAYATFIDITERKRAEAELCDESARRQLLMEQSRDGIIILDQDGRVYESNMAFAEMLGYPQESMRQLNVMDWECLHPAETVMEMIRSVDERGDHFETMHRRRDGSTYNVEISSNAAWFAGQKLVFCVCRDITDRKRAEEEIRRFKTIADNAVYGKTIADLQGNILYVNRFFANIHGYTPEELIGQHISVFHTPEQMKTADRIIASMMEAGHFAPMEVWHSHRDGTEFPMLMSGVVLKDEYGAPQYIAASAIDMTKSHKTEQDYRTLFHEMLEGFAAHEIICDEAGTPADYRFLKVNPAFERMTGLKADNIIGRTVLEVIPDTEPHWIETYGKVALSGEPALFENYSAKIGKHFAVTAFQSAPDQFACIFQDITQRKEAEEALARKQAELKAVYDNAPVMICVLDEERRVLFANPAFTAFTGIPEEELRTGRACGVFGCVNASGDPRGCGYGENCADCTLLQALEDTIKTGADHHGIETTLNLERGGTRQAITMLGATALLRTGEVNNVLLCLTEISEIKQAEARLREKTALLENITEHMFDMVAITGLDGVFTYAGPSHRALGFEPEQLVGTSVFDYVHPDDAAHIAREFRIFTANPTPDTIRTVEYRQRCGDGTYRWLETKGKVLFDDNGIPCALFFSSRDITERKQFEETLWRDTVRRQRQADLIARVALNRHLAEGAVQDLAYELTEAASKALEVGRVGVWIFNDDQTQLVCLDTYDASSGAHVSGALLSKSEFQNEFEELTNALYVAAHDALTDPRTAGYAEGYLKPNNITSMLDAAIKIEGRNLGTLCLEHVNKPHQWRKDEIVLACQLADQIALAMLHRERKHASEEREKLQAQLTQAQKMESVGRLAGGVAHDFNNMLGVILGHTELALDRAGPENAPLHADLKEIQNAAQRSADLTRQLLAFARKQTVTPKVFDINDAIDGMLKMLKRLIGEDIALSWKPGPNLWTVKMDPAQLDQVLANLCVNAKDAITGPGKVTIETANAVFDEKYCAQYVDFAVGEYVLLSVSDNGCGMDSETIARLFEPFFTTKELGKGTGLGLATVYGVVKQNNGFINVDSDPGKGTIFNIFLPKYLDESKPISRQRPSQSLKTGDETILVVEDEHAFLDITTLMLSKLGYAVLAASTTDEAIQLAKSHAGEIQLLITDVVMPQMNGPNLARKLLDLYPKLKHLFMSGYTADLINYKDVLDDKIHFIQKPFSMKTLSEKVREALEK